MSRTLAELKHEGRESELDHSGLMGMLAELKVMLGGVSKQMGAAEKDRAELVQAVGPFAPQSQAGTVASTALLIASAETLGPRTGKLWDVFRVSIGGNLVGSSTPSPTTPNSGNVPATGVAQQNTNAYPVSVAIAANGATITNVSVNGITVGTAAGTYTVPAFGSISVAYSVATPTWVWSGIAAPATVFIPIYKSATPTTAGATFQNFVCEIQVGGTQLQTFGKGQCVVRAGESLFAYQSTGLTNGQIGVLTVEGIEVAAPYVGEYFI